MHNINQRNELFFQINILIFCLQHVSNPRIHLQEDSCIGSNGKLCGREKSVLLLSLFYKGYFCPPWLSVVCRKKSRLRYLNFFPSYFGNKEYDWLTWTDTLKTVVRLNFTYKFSPYLIENAVHFRSKDICWRLRVLYKTEISCIGLY